MTEKKTKEHQIRADDNESIVKVILMGGEDEEQLVRIAPQGDGGVNQPEIGKADRTEGAVETTVGLGTDVEKPPYNAQRWSGMMEMSTRLARSIRITTQNTVGLGYGFFPPEGIKLETDELKNRYAIQEEILDNYFDNCGGKETFIEIMKKVKTDEEAAGNGFLESIRNLASRPSKVNHLPGHTMFVRKDGIGYLQVRGQKKKYFKEYGDLRIINAETGEASNDSLPLEKRATEVIQFKVHSPRSTYYGIPRYVSASTAIVGTRLASVRNFVFFKNDAVPRMIISVSGGQLVGDSINMIKKFFKAEAQGADKAHRVMVLQAEPKQITLSKDNPTKIDVKPLTVGSQDDASFEKYRKANNEEIREAFGIGLIFFGTTDDISRGNAIESKKVTIEQEFIPDSISHEHRINVTLVRDLLSSNETAEEKEIDGLLDKNEKYANLPDGYLKAQYKETVLRKQGIELLEKENGKQKVTRTALVEFRFKRPTYTDEESEAKTHAVLQSAGILAIDESREALKKPPFKTEWSKYPLPFAKQEFSGAEAQTSVTDPIQETMQSLFRLRDFFTSYIEEPDDIN